MIWMNKMAGDIAVQLRRRADQIGMHAAVDELQEAVEAALKRVGVVMESVEEEDEDEEDDDAGVRH